MEESKRPLADETPEEAILVSLDTGEFDVEISLDELEELARTAGARVTGRRIQTREAPDKATCIGSGRREELREVGENTGVDLVIFDLELSATQHRNLTDALPCRACISRFERRAEMKAISDMANRPFSRISSRMISISI